MKMKKALLFFCLFLLLPAACMAGAFDNGSWAWNQSSPTISIGGLVTGASGNSALTTNSAKRVAEESPLSLGKGGTGFASVQSSGVVYGNGAAAALTSNSILTFDGSTLSGVGATFTGNVAVGTFTVNGASSATFTGPVVVSSAVGSATPVKNAVYNDLTNKVAGSVAVSGGVDSVTWGVNITSVTRVAGGQVQLNFSRPFASASNYACVAMSTGAAVCDYTSQLAASIIIETRSLTTGLLLDNVGFHAVCDGSQ